MHKLNVLNSAILEKMEECTWDAVNESDLQNHIAQMHKILLQMCGQPSRFKDKQVTNREIGFRQREYLARYTKFMKEYSLDELGRHYNNRSEGLSSAYSALVFELDIVVQLSTSTRCS